MNFFKFFRVRLTLRSREAAFTLLSRPKNNARKYIIVLEWIRGTKPHLTYSSEREAYPDMIVEFDVQFRDMGTFSPSSSSELTLCNLRILMVRSSFLQISYGQKLTFRNASLGLGMLNHECSKHTCFEKVQTPGQSISLRLRDARLQLRTSSKRASR